MTEKQIFYNLLLVLALIALNDNQLTPVNGQFNQPNPKCDIKVQHVGPNYIIYQKPIWSISARPFKLPSYVPMPTIFNSTVAQLPRVNTEVDSSVLSASHHNSLVVPLLKRTNFVENTWYLICARADKSGHCERCDVVLRSNCQNMFTYSDESSFLDLTIEKWNTFSIEEIDQWNTKPVDQNQNSTVNFNVYCTSRKLANPMPFDYALSGQLAREPFECNSTDTELLCGGYVFSDTVLTLPAGLDGTLIERRDGENPKIRMYTLNVSVELKIGATVRRHYPGMKVIPDTYRIDLEPFKVARSSGLKKKVLLTVPFMYMLIFCLTAL